MDMKTKLGIGAALGGAFALGLTAITFSTAQQATPTDQGDRSSFEASISPAVSEDINTSFSDLQEDEIRALVKNYLLTNPEVIIEAVNLYSRQQQALSEARATEMAAANLEELLDPAHGFVAGQSPDQAKVAVIELADYHCGFCKRAAPLVKTLTEKEKDVKVIFREYPILREESDYAAEVALAAREQGKFLEMHFAMMEAQGVLTKDRIAQIAKKQGVNLKKLETARQQDNISSAIIRTQEIARDMQIGGTPAFIVASVDGDYLNVIEGFRPDELIASIEEARAASN